MSSSIDMDKIIAEVKAKRLLLDACAGHDFSIPVNRINKVKIEPGMPTNFCDWRCAKCGGWVDGIARVWYNRGVAHEQARVAGCLA